MGLSKRRFTEMQDYVAEKKKEDIDDIEDIEETYRKLRLKEKEKRQNKSPSR